MVAVRLNLRLCLGCVIDYVMLVWMISFSFLIYLNVSMTFYVLHVHDHENEIVNEYVNVYENHDHVNDFD